jgi:DsbC/DsbD-like thiol-disulfide interchange protein
MAIAAGRSAGEIQWPLPEKLPPAEVTTYGYENEVMLLVPLTIATNLPAGPIDLKANVSWLECKEVCIPANQDVQATLNIGSETKLPPMPRRLNRGKIKRRRRITCFHFSAWWEKPADDDTRPLIIGKA